MNFALYHHRKLSEIISVPKGLPELMADMTKQILKFQPQNMEEFLAGYLDALVQTRELMYVAETTVQDMLTHSLEVSELMKKVNMTMKQANQACEIIKEEFVKHLSTVGNIGSIKEFDIIKRLICECNLSVEQARKVSKIIEVSWKFFYNQNKISFCNNKRESSCKWESKDYDGNIQKDKEDAAIKIQSWYRGLKNKENERKEFELLQKSALIIQTSIRNYIQREKNNKPKK